MSVGGVSELERSLGSDLAALVSTITVPLIAATPLRGGGAPGHRAFRLQFADGRTYKGREVHTPQQAEVVEWVSRCVGGGGLPAVLARAGRALLMEWIEGRSLDTGHCPVDVLRQSGALQGVLHTCAVPETAPHRPRDPLGSQQARLQRRLDELVTAAVLERSEARRIVAVSTAHVPEHCAVGFISGDLCAENIVMRTSGDLCMVDTEGLEIGPCDYDLGRTWYRWPMHATQRTAYLEGYRAHRSVEEFWRHFPYWAIIALVDAAVFRQRRRAGDATVPLGVLRAVVRAVEGHADIDALLALSEQRDTRQ